MSTGASAPPFSNQDERTSGSYNYDSQQYDSEENSIPEKNYLSIGKLYRILWKQWEKENSDSRAFLHIR